jgi:desulfoferrodoxin-like iron-binding protein
MNKAASRLKCEVCGGEVVVTKAGDGALHCCDKPMTPR